LEKINLKHFFDDEIYLRKINNWKDKKKEEGVTGTPS